MHCTKCSEVKDCPASRFREKLRLEALNVKHVSLIFVCTPTQNIMAGRLRCTNWLMLAHAM